MRLSILVVGGLLSCATLTLVLGPAAVAQEEDGCPNPVVPVSVPGSDVSACQQALQQVAAAAANQTCPPPEEQGEVPCRLVRFILEATNEPNPDACLATIELDCVPPTMQQSIVKPTVSSQ